MTFDWKELCQCNTDIICGVHKIQDYIDLDFCEDLLNCVFTFEEIYEN